MPVIAIDGPAASGKGTLARKLADHLGYAHLDTGGLYRAVGLGVLRAGGNPEKESDALNAVKNLQNMDLSDPELRSESTGAAASKVASINAVRAALLEFQRDFAANPPTGTAGAVLDGRDIGTVICPDADVKIFVIADVETRAQRRFDELKAKLETPPSYADVLAELKDRDDRDMNRATAPLTQAKDAYLLDTTNSDIEAVFESALALVNKKLDL